MLRLFLFWGVSSILMVTGGGSQAIPDLDAQLAPGGIISGRVTDESGNGIKGIIVDIYDLNQLGIAYSYTDSAGKYSIDAIPEGSYKIYFGGSFNGNYLGQWYHDAVSFDVADPVVVTAGLATPDIDAQLSTGGSINGHLSDNLGKNIQGIAVDIYDLNQLYIASTSTNEAGNYSLGGLPDGSYKIYFAGSLQLNNRSEWYNDKNSFGAADSVAVTVGQITPNIDAQLTQGGILSGRVTDDLGAGLPDIIVDIYDLSHSYIDYTYTDKQGNYSFGGLPEGSYKIYFSVYQQNFFPQWYNGKASFETADPVMVMGGQPTTNIDARLTPGGSIRGRVTDNSGKNIQGITVDIYDLNHLYLASTTTGRAGHYSVAGLPGGSYMIYFGSSTFQDYLSEWYNDKISFETADPVTVTVGQTTSAVDVQLAVGGIIRGRVTDEPGNGIQGIMVEIYDLNNLDIAAISTDSAGFYSHRGLPEGSYKIYFKVSQQNFFSEWYNDRDSFETADPVAVIDGHTFNINAQLAPAGIISGRITDAVTGVGIQGIDIYVYDANGNAINENYTDENGNYTVKNLPTGNFKINFDTYYYNQSSVVKYKNQWYNNKDSVETADIVAVTAGQITSGLNATLSSDDEMISGHN